MHLISAVIMAFNLWTHLYISHVSESGTKVQPFFYLKISFGKSGLLFQLKFSGGGGEVGLLPKFEFSAKISHRFTCNFNSTLLNFYDRAVVILYAVYNACISGCCQTELGSSYLL